MNFEELLREKPCSCGMTHRCSIKHVIIESGAVKKVGTLLAGYSHVLLVADTNTYKTCGREVEAQIGERLESVLVYQREGLLIPNEVLWRTVFRELLLRRGMRRLAYLAMICFLAVALLSSLISISLLPITIYLALVTRLYSIFGVMRSQIWHTPYRPMVRFSFQM